MKFTPGRKLHLLLESSTSIHLTSEMDLSDPYKIAEIESFWTRGIFFSFEGQCAKKIQCVKFVGNNNQKNLVFSSGRTEAYLKYKELAFDFYSNGFNVYMIDHRGQGLSERLIKNRQKGFVEEFDYYAEDLKQFIVDYVPTTGTSSKKPLLLGHSMGAAIGIRVLQKYPNLIETAVFSAPMIAINTGKIPLKVADLIIDMSSKVNKLVTREPWYILGGHDYKEEPFDINMYTHSEIRYQRCAKEYKETEEIQLGSPTLFWVEQAFAICNTIFSDLKKINTPILLLQAEADTIVDNRCQDKFCEKLNLLSPHIIDIKPTVISGAYHELLVEKDIYRQIALEQTINRFQTVANNKHHER